MNRRIALVWPAGNAGIECSNLENAIWGVASGPHSISVGALDERLRPQPYSSRGAGQCVGLHPTVSAPTYGVLPYGGGFQNLGAQGGGTSSAAALVAGVVALMTSLHPDAPTAEIARILRTSASPVFRDNAVQIGGGLIQTRRALDALMG